MAKTNNTSTIRIKDVLFSIKKYRNIIIGTCIAGFLAGMIICGMKYFSAKTSENYEFTASFAVTSQSEDGLFMGNSNNPDKDDMMVATDMVDAVIYVCKSEAVLSKAVAKLSLLGVTSEEIRMNLTLQQYNETQIVEMHFFWPSQDEGVMILTAITEEAPEVLMDTLKIGNVTIVNAPKVKPVENGLNIMLIIELAMLGVFAGIAYAVSQLFIHPTLVQLSDVYDLFELNTLAEIPSDKGFHRQNLHSDILDRRNIGNAFLESYSTAAHILLHQIDKDGSFSMFVTSSLQEEGKSSVTANLAIEFANLDKKTLIIDFDVRRPTIGGMFMEKTDYEHSLNAAYFDDVSAKDAVVKLDKNLYILPTRVEKKKLSIDKFANKLIDVMKEEYDVILIDTAPVGQVADTLYFSNIVDYAVYVIKYDEVWIDIIQDNIKKLKKTNANLLGCIINGVNPEAYETLFYYKNNRGKYTYNAYTLSRGIDDEAVETGDDKSRKKNGRKKNKNDENIVDDNKTLE